MSQEVKENFDKIKAALITVSPFMASILRRTKIVLTESVPTAGATSNYVVLVNPKFFSKLSFKDKCWILCHETMHVAFSHTTRGKSTNPIVWNIAADAVVNNILEGFIKCSDMIKRFSVRMDDIYGLLCLCKINVDYNEFKKMSVEEIYRLLLKIKDPSVQYEPDIKGGDFPVNGDVLQEGDPEIYNKENPDEVAEEWRKAIVKAYAQQKLVGNVPLGLQRLVNNLLESKIDWKVLLRQAIHDGLGKLVVTTWKRPSRKHEDFPGIRRFTYPTVHCLVDCSGSISDKQLEQFISEVYAIAKNSPIIVIPWDAEAYTEVKADNPSEVISKVATMLKGGGGTVNRV